MAPYTAAGIGKTRLPSSLREALIYSTGDSPTALAQSVLL
jgi:hypothetical protein